MYLNRPPLGPSACRSLGPSLPEIFKFLETAGATVGEEILLGEYTKNIPKFALIQHDLTNIKMC